MVAVVPIRSESKGIPGKNLKVINGKPLVWWTLKALNDCEDISLIVVAIDPAYKTLISKFKFDKVVEYIRRPENSRDDSSTESVLLEVIDAFDIAEDVILAQATSPLTTTEDICRGIEIYRERGCSSVISVVKQKRFIWTEDGTALNYDIFNRPRRQDWEGHYVENGAFYIADSYGIRKHRSRVYGKIQLCEMKEHTYYEIDSEEDFEIVGHLLKQQNK